MGHLQRNLTTLVKVSHTLQKWVILEKISHTKIGSRLKGKSPLKKMCYTLKNGSRSKKFATL